MNGMSYPFFLDELQRLQAVETRHGVVGDDQVPGFAGQRVNQSLGSLHPFEFGRVAAAPQIKQQQLGIGLRVLDDQNAKRFHWLRVSAAGRERVRSSPASTAQAV